MKQVLFFFFLLIPLLSYCQQQGTVEYLDANPRFGEIMLGDSITRNLLKLHLLEEKSEKGGFRCEISQYDLKNECYKIGGISPFAVYVDVKNYLIKGVLVYFLNDRKDLVEVLAELFRKYGQIEATESGFEWYGKEVAVIANYSDDMKTFHVAYLYLK